MRVFLLLLTLLCSVQVRAQGSVKFEFTAKGCCPMCEDRIVAALDVPGVRAAEWDQFDEKAMVVYKPKKISEEQIQQLGRRVSGARLARGGQPHVAVRGRPRGLHLPWIVRPQLRQCGRAQFPR